MKLYIIILKEKWEMVFILDYTENKDCDEKNYNKSTIF